MNKDNQIYAAYGSNLNLEQMARRCPYATVIGNAELPGHRLVFRGFNGGAVATVEPQEGSSVPVLLWEITPRDEQELDRYEGWPSFYRKETVVVAYEGQLVEAMAYIMNEGRPVGMPSIGYLKAICNGYQSAGFDPNILAEALQLSS